MRRAPVLIVLLAVAASVGLVSRAHAGTPTQFPDGFGVHDFCADEDHSGPPYPDPNGGPPIDTPSIIPFGGSLDEMPVDSFTSSFELEAMRPSGSTVSYRGPILDDATFQGALGISEGGEYPITSFTVILEGADGTSSSESIDPSEFPDGGVMSVTFDASQPCDASTVEPGTTVAVGEAGADETAPDPEPEERESDDATDIDDAADGDDGFPWEVLAFAGVGIFGAGLVLWLVGRPGRPCIEELRAWQAAKDACEAARERQRQAARELEDARDERERAEEALEELCEEYPPACRPESWIEDAETGERVDSTDLWVGRQWARQAWDSYADAPGEERARRTEEAWKDGPPDDWADSKREELDAARERHDRLEERVDEAARAEEAAEEAARDAREAAERACRDAEQKRRAYEECVAAEVDEAAADGTPSPAGTAEGSGGSEGSDAAGPGGLTSAAEPREGGPCEPGEERVEELATFGPRDVAADFSIIAVPDGMHGFQDGGQLAVRLGQLAQELDAAFDLLGGAGAGKAAAAGRYGSAGAQAQGTVTDIPSSIPDAIGEVLEFTAGLGSTVAGSVDRWMERHESFNVRSPVFVWRIEARWLEVWRCEDGEWTCSRELEFRKGRLRKTQLHRDADVTALGLDAELRRRAVGLQAKVRSDLEAVQEFLDRHTPGPCS